MQRPRAMPLVLAALAATLVASVAFGQDGRARALPYRAVAAAAWAVSAAWGAHLPWLPAPPPALSVAAGGRSHPLRAAATNRSLRRRVLASIAARTATLPTHASLLRDQPPVTSALPVLIERNSLTLMARPDVRCDKCVASAATAETGEDNIIPTLDVRALTTVQVGDAVLRLTSVRPFSLLFRKHF